MAQPDSDGQLLSSLWVEAAREKPLSPSPLSRAANALGGQDNAGEAVAIAAERELLDLVFAVASTTLEMHRMTVDRVAPSVPLWSLSRIAADAMGRIFLICTELQELRGWARVRRRNTEQAGKFWSELSNILPEGVELPTDLGPDVTLERLDAALAGMMEEPPDGFQTATDAHHNLTRAACARMLGADRDESAVVVHAGILQALYRLAGNAVHLSSPLTFDRQQTTMCFGWLGILTPETLTRFREFAGVRPEQNEANSEY